MAARIDHGRAQLLTRTGLDWSNRYLTTPYESSRAANGRTAGMRMPRSTEVESQCFRFDPVGRGFERTKPCEPIIVLARNKLRSMLRE
jgi:hypothetical protein